MAEIAMVESWCSYIHFFVLYMNKRDLTWRLKQTAWMILVTVRACLICFVAWRIWTSPDKVSVMLNIDTED